MKYKNYSLKNVYKKILLEQKVSIETNDGFFDYEFPDNVNFRSLKFYDPGDGSSYGTERHFDTQLVRVISKTPTSTTDFGKTTAYYGVKDFLVKYINNIDIENITKYYNSSDGIDKSKTSYFSNINSLVANEPKPETGDIDEVKELLQRFVGGMLSYFIIQILKNVLISDKRVYGQLIKHYNSSDELPINKVNAKKCILRNCIKDKLQNNNIILNMLREISVLREPKKQNHKINISFFNVFKEILMSDDILVIIKASTKIKTYLEFYFKDTSRRLGDKITTPEVWPLIAKEYISDSKQALSEFLRAIDNYNKNNTDEISPRQNVNSIDEVKLILDKVNKIEDIKKINSLYTPANRKGRGEFLCHMLFNTQNACLSIEPDVLLPNGMNISVKSSKSGDARTGENMDLNVRDILNSIVKVAMPNMTRQDISFLNVSTLNNAADNAEQNITKKGIEEIQEIFSYINGKNYNHIKVNSFTSLIESLKIEITTEHDASAIIHHNKSDDLKLIKKESLTGNDIILSALKNNRWSFEYKPASASSSTKTFERALINLVKKLDNEYTNLLSAQQSTTVTSSYKPQGKVLKEVYSHLFKKKIINEGGLAGHMMHPYEALDMTPRQIIDRIKEYSTSQSIIEKVDGQNLFFTVEQDGTLMFARNKEDMTHDDLVTKFTGHPAELPFVEGGNAIKNGVKQWLQSAGDAAEMEIREIFHPAGEIKSFINFEIMHPDKPNQIVYDEKYIVFHSIIDYVDGRKTVHSTNKGQRLEKVLSLMDSGVSAAGFTLASNRTVNLNELTNVQIEDYVERIKVVANSLGITEDQFLGKGIENKIENEIKSLGIKISDKDLKTLYDFALYGEDISGNKIKSKDFTSNMEKPDITKLRSIDLTSASKALKKVQKMLSPFKEIFVDLGIDLLKGVKSSYMSDETNQMNIDLLKDKLEIAIDDLIDYMQNTSEKYWEAEAHRLRPHLDKVIDKDIDSIVSTAVEGGVYDYQGDLLKVTGGFAPLNQILGAAYRDKKGMFPTFKEKFMKQESNKRSLKNTYKILF